MIVIRSMFTEFVISHFGGRHSGGDELKASPQERISKIFSLKKIEIFSRWNVTILIMFFTPETDINRFGEPPNHITCSLYDRLPSYGL
jgi:hypothetical protein